ncbi:ABC transporter ATP-binding protein [Chitinimonas sp.]|uniref:ABC transporter ATP-binding protein n=1 Tax=Chitinimonas sp. TaxID=1934313 RepID=UPI0035AF1249
MKIENVSLMDATSVPEPLRVQSDRPMAITVEAVSKHYGAVTALNDVSLQIQQGHTVALIGPNGAGKSTLVEILVGLKKPDSGTVNVLGNDVVRNPRANAERIGVQFQDSRLFDQLSVRDYLQLFKSFYAHCVDQDQLVAQLGLQASLDKRVKSLSGGYKQRLALALALINDPAMVFLDEPATGLDPIVRRQFWDLILQLKSDKKTILFSTHYMEEAKVLADYLIMISHGRIIAQGTQAQIISQAGSDCASLDDAYKFHAQAAERGASC